MAGSVSEAMRYLNSNNECVVNDELLFNLICDNLDKSNKKYDYYVKSDSWVIETL